jgi:hypothetical protein
MISQQTHMSTDEQIVILIPVYNDWTSVTQLIVYLGGCPRIGAEAKTQKFENRFWLV